jgi:hypothetical protein
MHPVREGRAECIALLVRKLHEEVVERIRRTIGANEASTPESGSLPDLLAGREWLFGEYDYYVDTSHLYSVLPYSLETEDAGTLRLVRELCDYGRRLSAMFQSPGQPPFERPFVDYDEYAAAVLGDDVDRRIAHFRTKVEETDPEVSGLAAAEFLVNLLVRLRRYREAVEISLRWLAGAEMEELQCPSVAALCSMAEDWDRLRAFSSERGDLLNYLAASVMNRATAQRA